MPGREIERCSTCTFDCDEFYERAATELLFGKKILSDTTIEDKERLLTYRIREIAKCALSDEQISGNLKGLIDGERDIHG